MESRYVLRNKNCNSVNMLRGKSDVDNKYWNYYSSSSYNFRCWSYLSRHYQTRNNHFHCWIALWIIVPLFVPFPLSLVINGAYWLWQLVDVIRLYRKVKSEFGANYPYS